MPEHPLFLRLSKFEPLEICSLRDIMLREVKNDKDIDIPKLRKIIPDEILDDFEDKLLGICPECEKYFYNYRYKLTYEYRRKGVDITATIDVFSCCILKNSFNKIKEILPKTTSKILFVISPSSKKKVPELIKKWVWGEK